jgi:Oligosaccaryltransferase
MDSVQMDENLMHFVNTLGVLTFVSIVVYHFITATPKDAEA